MLELLLWDEDIEESLLSELEESEDSLVDFLLEKLPKLVIIFVNSSFVLLNDF